MSGKGCDEIIVSQEQQQSHQIEAKMLCGYEHAPSPLVPPRHTCAFIPAAHQVPDELHLQKSQDRYFWSYWAEANNSPFAASKPLLFVWTHVTVMKASNWSMGDMTVRQGSLA